MRGVEDIDYRFSLLVPYCNLSRTLLNRRFLRCWRPGLVWEGIAASPPHARNSPAADKVIRALGNPTGVVARTDL